MNLKYLIVGVSLLSFQGAMAASMAHTDPSGQQGQVDNHQEESVREFLAKYVYGEHKARYVRDGKVISAHELLDLTANPASRIEAFTVVLTLYEGTYTLGGVTGRNDEFRKALAVYFHTLLPAFEDERLKTSFKELSHKSFRTPAERTQREKAIDKLIKQALYVIPKTYEKYVRPLTAPIKFVDVPLEEV